MAVDILLIICKKHNYYRFYEQLGIGNSFICFNGNLIIACPILLFYPNRTLIIRTANKIWKQTVT
ncbi:hypothetical protein, partial [Oenococcus oeni]|uniref:hypothetical protein n=1 Tax=Oenococcus oeni TaxID=1247 RepID=UPI001C5AA5CB